MTVRSTVRRVGFLVSRGACAIAITASAWCAAPLRADDQAGVALVEISGALREKAGPLDWLTGGEPTLRGLIEIIDAAAANTAYKAMFIRVKDAELSATQIEELGSALKRARGAGKRVYLFGESLGASDLMLGSYADEIIVQTGGGVELPGVYMEEMFLADTLAWAGIKADMVQVGDYKGANEQMSRSSPSPQWDENISGLLDSLYANLRTKLKTGRNFTDAQLDEAMEKAWLSDAAEAKEARLVDATLDLPDLTPHLKDSLKAEVNWSDNLAEPKAATLDTSNPFAMMQKILGAKPDAMPDGPCIAIVHIDGVIVDGDSTSGGMFGEESVGSRTLRNAIEEAASHDQIKGVIVRIDSPGGSATASEVIWQGVRKLAAKKTVWVSVGSMAASGGYYCAVAGDKIYVNPSSIVGSIGVVGGRMSLAGLYDKFHVRVVGRARGPRAGLFRTTEPWTAQEIGLVRAKMQKTYDLFTSRVTAGRKGIELSKTAEGRLVAGQKAVDLKMADEVGGLHEAIADLASELRLESYEVIDLPGPKPLEEVIQEAIKGFASAPGVGSKSPATMRAASELAEQLLGRRAAAELRRAAAGLMLMEREPVLVMSPRVLMFK